MRYDLNNQLPSQRRRHEGISYLFPLTFLLIFVFTQSLAGLFTSLAIIALLWVLLAVGSSSSWRQHTPPMQPPLIQPLASPYEPEEERLYEQGYLGTSNTGGPALQAMAPFSSQASPYQPVPRGPENGGEGDRLAQLQLLGDLYHAGALTEDEFTRQKKQILQDDAVREASEPEATPAPVFELEYEEQPPISTHKSSSHTAD